MNLFRRFASVFFVFFPTTRLKSFKLLKFNKIFVILNKDLKSFLYNKVL